MSIDLAKPIETVVGYPTSFGPNTDVYFSADVETDGPVPGPFSLLSFGLVYAGAFDGHTYFRPPQYDETFYAELKPISDRFELEALQVNGLDRDKLTQTGLDPHDAMSSAEHWIRKVAGEGMPVFVAYPLSFDWSWMNWYFVNFSKNGSPFGYSRCFDIKTAIAVKLRRLISKSGRNRIPEAVKSPAKHTHHALDDAIEQAEIFSNVFVME